MISPPSQHWQGARGWRRAAPAKRRGDSAGAIYDGGDVLTRAGDSPRYVEALVFDDVKIVAIGAKVDLPARTTDASRKVDLRETTSYRATAMFTVLKSTTQRR